jgi:hypothetical protein
VAQKSGREREKIDHQHIKQGIFVVYVKMDLSASSEWDISVLAVTKGSHLCAG